MSTWLWLPQRTADGPVYPAGFPDMPAPGDGLPAEQYVTAFDIPFKIGVSGTTTIIVCVRNDAEVPLCTKAIPTSQVPAADIAEYSNELAAFVASGFLTKTFADQIAILAGLTPP